MSSALAQRHAETLQAAYGGLEARALVEVLVRREFPGTLAVTSSFGAEAAVLLDIVASVDADLPVIFLDTDALFDETLDYVKTLSARLGLTNLRIIRPEAADLREADELWRSDPDRCCYLRKVLPLEKATAGFRALIDGRKQVHGGERGNLGKFQAAANGAIKISPLADWSVEDVERAMIERDLPRHPLVAQGYRSVGCYPCTRPTAPGESPRSGRWAGQAKTECGIHKI